MRILSIFVLTIFLIALCAPLYAQEGGSDDILFDRVRVKLAADPVVKGGTFEVTVKDGVVTLRGKVEKEKQRGRAEHLVRKVKGVKNVVNELKVEPR